MGLNYGHCDTATRNGATEWSLRVTATQLLKKGDMGYLVIDLIIVFRLNYYKVILLDVHRFSNQNITYLTGLGELFLA